MLEFVEYKPYQVYEWIAYMYGYDKIRHSAIDSKEHQDFIIECMTRSPVNKCLELGTLFGVSTVLLAEWSNFVYTIDKDNCMEKYRLWEHTKTMNKIMAMKSYDNRHKEQICRNLDFDFCFIDDQHDYEGAEIGYEIGKKCGRVLFHDYGTSFPGITKFVDKLPIEEMTIEPPFAYWEAKNG